MSRSITTFFVIILFQATAFAQLKGEFCHNFGFGVECIKFLSNNRFEYSHNHCTGNDKGNGFYTLNGDDLLLQFETDSVLNAKSKIEVKQEIASSDTVTIDAFIYSLKDGEPLTFVAVMINDTSDHIINSALTDMSGHCILKVSKKLNRATFQVPRFIGYPEYTNEIILDKNYTYKLYLVNNFGRIYNSEDTKRYKIKNISKKNISLKGEYNGAEFQLYER